MLYSQYTRDNVVREMWNARTRSDLSQKIDYDEALIKDEAKTYYQMITEVLNEIPTQEATKEEIISSISKNYDIDISEIEKKVAQCLAKKFDRRPGSYRLKNGINIPALKDDATKSVKDRLIYVLHYGLSDEGTLSQIRQKYQEEFKEELDTRVSASSNQAVWEKTILKTLLKCNEFDKSKSKTKYRVIRIGNL